MYIRKQNKCTEYFGGRISLDTVETAGAWLDDATYNWKSAGIRLS